MSEKKSTDNIRFSQVLAGALAAITAAVLGSTMGVAGTVIGAGLASAVTTVGGALYMRSIQRTKQSVRTVRDMVVARAGGTSVTLVEEHTEKAPVSDTDTETDTEKATDEADGAATGLAEGTGLETHTEITEGEPAPPESRKLRWPALIAASVLAFLVGMLVITGVEAIRGAPLSGGNGTTVGDIVRQDSSGDDGDDNAPPATTRTTPDPTTSTVTDTPPTSDEEEEPATPSSGVSEPETTAPDTTTDNAPTGSVPVPETGQSG
jgi:hypothetical protein